MAANPLATTSEPLLGTAGGDIITGSFAAELISGGPGVDQLSGGPGADRFALTFGDRQADVILDFTPGQDKIQIDGVTRGSRLDRVLKGAAESSKVLRTVDGRKAASAAKTLYSYDAQTGNLYFNANGSKKGFGSGGGVVAELPPGLELRGRDLQFNYAPPLA